jgi:Uma2 family endonuclease
MDSGVDGMSFSPTGGFRLADGSCLSPDGAWISGERWNGLTPEEQDGYPPLCPDFLVELRSRSDRRSVLEEKMQLWMANGARLAWLNDPFEATVTIYRQGAAEQTLHRPDEVAADEPARGFVSRTARFWPQH